MIRIAIIALVLMTFMNGSAFAYCSEPSSEPWCLSEDDSFRTENGFDDCRWQVEQFVEDVNDFVECLEGEQRNLRDEIEDLVSEVEAKEDEKAEQIERANDVVRRFNCGADSGEACW